MVEISFVAVKAKLALLFLLYFFYGKFGSELNTIDFPRTDDPGFNFLLIRALQAKLKILRNC